MANPKICLIYTGGTIGMKRDAHGTLRPPENPDDFLRVEPELEELVDLDFVALMNKDSTNINPDDWANIATSISTRIDLGYDGFVVAHGTDTMHFTASAVAFALGWPLPVPIVFTGSQAIPEVKHGDARVNLLRACKVATMDIGEVVISFGDYVFRGCRAQKKDERRFDAFETPAYYPLAHVAEDIDIQPVAKKRSTERMAPLSADFEHGIVQLSLIPGLEPTSLLPVLNPNTCKGLILQSFGAGNVPSEGKYSFESLISHATELHIPVIITSQFPANATLHTAYEPGQFARRAGAIATGNMTSSCAVAKFRWVLAQVNAEFDGADSASRTNRLKEGKLNKVNEMMQHVYVGEMDQECVEANGG